MEQTPLPQVQAGSREEGGWAKILVVRQFPNTWAPVVILLKKIISDALPPRVMHIRSNNCSVVYKYCSLGKYCA